MPQHRREQVLNAVVGLLTGLPTAGPNAFRQFVYTFQEDQLPSYNVLQGEETPRVQAEDGAVFTFTDRDLVVLVELRADGLQPTPEATVNQLESEAVAALLADPRLGLGSDFVLDTLEGETSELENDGTGDEPVVLVTKTFMITYRTDGVDPSQ